MEDNISPEKTKIQKSARKVGGVSEIIGGGPQLFFMPVRIENSSTYRVYLPKRLVRTWCQLEGCLGGASNWTNLQVQFMYRHARDTMILVKGNQPYPRFPKCDMFVFLKAIKVRHLATEIFCRGE